MPIVEKPPSFTCPRCGAVSYNPHDISYRYCGRCHVFVDDVGSKRCTKALKRGWHKVSELCHCGKPLHYSDPATRAAVERNIARAGDPFIDVTVEGHTWRVQRHYIALHGIKGWELPSLGFEEVLTSRCGD